MPLASILGPYAAAGVWTLATGTGLPWLQECEGLERELMPYYNSVLYLSAAAALLATVRENRTAPKHLPIGMLGLVPALIAFQHWEHGRLLRQAQARRAWWNRRLRRHR